MPGTPLGITLPVVSTTVGPQYATDINLAIQTIIDDVEAQIVPSEIDINTDVTFESGGTSFAALLMERLNMENKGATPGSAINSVYVIGGELYYQDALTNEVQITSAGTVNTAGSGNIQTTGAPAYGVSDVELLWDGTNSVYRFKAGTGGDVLADIEIRNAEFGVGANRTVLTSGGLNGTLTLFPNVAAGVDEVCMITSAGLLISTATPTVTNFTTTGFISAGGLITATMGVTAAANQDFTVSGTGDYVHGNREVDLPAAHGMKPDLATFDSSYTFVAAAWGSLAANRMIIDFPLSGVLKAGDRIQNLDVHLLDVIGETHSITLFEMTQPAGAPTAVSNVTVSAGDGTNQQLALTGISFNGATNILDTSRTYFIRAEVTVATTINHAIFGVRLVYDRP